MRKTPQKKRGLKARSNVDPARVALTALDRIKTVLVKSGYKDRIGEPLSQKELDAQAAFLGTELPPSYVATMRVASKIGEPDVFLVTSEMESQFDTLILDGISEATRYAPFCRGEDDRVICFDKGGGRRLVSSMRHQGELPIVEWQGGMATPVAAHFGEWLDMIADAREEQVETAAKMPERLKRLLFELGFRFEYPVVGRMETADAEAITLLIGEAMERQIRGDVDRLFDTSGKASLTLNVDEFRLQVVLRTGAYTFEAEDVFRWFRAFRDENFFSEAVTKPNHPDAVRDLRRAPREAPLVQRGVLHVAISPAGRLSFKAASGAGANDFYLLGRNAMGASAILHVVDGVASNAHEFHEALNDLHVTKGGTVWGLTTTSAVKFVPGARPMTFPLTRGTRGRPWWHGIGGAGDRVFVYGTGALLELDGQRFRPFVPDAHLDENETIRGLHARGLRLWMLVCGDRVGAVARFDSKSWEAITEHQVIDGSLLDLDVWRNTSYVLDQKGGVWSMDPSSPPRPVGLTYHQAFVSEQGTPRPLHGLRAFDGGILLASDGGAIAVGQGDPLFHAVPNARDPVRLVRVGAISDADARDSAIVALGGGNAWVWRASGRDPAGFSVVDLHAW